MENLLDKLIEQAVNELKADVELFCHFLFEGDRDSQPSEMGQTVRNSLYATGSNHPVVFIPAGTG
jgi:hypothetical protein